MTIVVSRGWMSDARDDGPEILLAGLTDKQRGVLDLLLLHKTSKEIARDLGISPHTVDQRIRFAKEKLGVSRRSDLATSYRSLLSVCEETVYEESRIHEAAISMHKSGGPSEDLIITEVGQKPECVASASDQGEEISLVPAIFDGPAGVWMRVGAVFGIAAAIIVVGIGGLAVFEQLSRMLA